VDIAGEVPDYFRGIIKNELERLTNDDEIKYREFFDINASSNEVRIMSINDDVMGFNSILNDIEHFVDLPPFNGIDKIKDIWAYAIEIEFNNDKLIYFRKYTASRIISKKGMTTIFYKDKLNKVRGDILAFDDVIDCIYYQSLGSIMILDKEKFENIFNFNEFYRLRSVKTLKRLSNLIDIDRKMIEDASLKTRTSRKITELSMSGRLESEYVRDLIKNKFFEKHKTELPMIMTYGIINGKIKIDDIKSLDAFLDTCAENYLKGLASENKYRTEHKERIS